MINFDFNNLIRFIISPDFSGLLLVFKILFLIFSLLFLSLILFFLLRTTWFRRIFLWNLVEFLTYRPYMSRKLIKQWTKIKKRLDSGLEAEYKLAVIESDSILNEALEKMGYREETLGEKLKKVPEITLSNSEQIQEAHKIRNSVVHDPDYRLGLDQAKKTILIYENALVDLGLI